MHSLLKTYLCGTLLLLGSSVLHAQPLAFEGAEGYGKYASGGRGGRVMVVTNLNDRGPGSLREALSTKKPAIVAFAVAGTIHLETELPVYANTTILGQTAPGDGICIADQSTSIKGDNVIIRYMRFRLGDKYQNKGMVDGSGSSDAIGGGKRKHIMIDHCSVSWSDDELLSLYNGDSSTIQWCLMSEPLNYSYHFETGDTDYERHGYGGILGGRHLSVHHNLYAHCASRTPRFDGNRNLGGDTERVDYRNNVIYNWKQNNVYGGEGGQYNISGNFYKFGPDTSPKVKNRIANPFRKEGTIPFGQWYVGGNYVDGDQAITMNNRAGVTLEKGSKKDEDSVLMQAPFEAPDNKAEPAWDAYEKVLAQAGASFRRDTMDTRIIDEVKQRKGTIIDVQGHYPHGTAYEQTLTAWPALAASNPETDSDGDGIPDIWESKHGLDPNKAGDAAEMLNKTGCSAIECYAQWLITSNR